MHITAPLLLALALTACTSTTLTSETLSDAEISAIQERVEEMHPNLSDEKQRAVVELAVKAMDNMVFVEGGSFMMGEFGVPCEPGSERSCMSDFDKSNDHAHRVTLDSYFLSRYETTMGDFDLYRYIRGKEPYAKNIRQVEGRKGLFDKKKPAWTKDWSEVRDYCLWVGELTDKPVALPSEAQWEYAARNRGKPVLYATNNGEIEEGENYPSPEERRGTLPVGTYPANPLGLYDMASNTSEWVSDWFSEDYYERSPEINPHGPQTGTKKVSRTGGYYISPDLNTTVGRYSQPVSNSSYSEIPGFRCAVIEDYATSRSVLLSSVGRHANRAKFFWRRSA